MLSVDVIKKMAYCDDDTKNLSIPEMILYIESNAAYKLYNNGLINEKTAKERIVSAENDYKSFKLLYECFNKNLELDGRLEHLKCEYNKTKSEEAARKIADFVTSFEVSF